jgi:putative peptidoglycan binding protein
VAGENLQGAKERRRVPIRERCNMRITSIFKIASLVISSVMIQTTVAGHAVGIGVGPRFGEGGFGGDLFWALFGSSDFHSATGSDSGVRFSLGTNPTFQQPMIVRSAPRIRTLSDGLTTSSHQRDAISSVDCESRANSHRQIASRVRQPSGRAGNHIVSRQSASVHRANNEGVYHGNPSPDPTVTAVQQNLTKLGYYRKCIDGLYGRATRYAVARYQTDHNLAVTSRLTRQMLQLLGVSPTSRTEMGSELGTNRTRELMSRLE